MTDPPPSGARLAAGKVSAGSKRSAADSAREARRTRCRRWLFCLVAVLLPPAALLIAEATCRLAGFGGYPPIIIDVGDDGTRHWYSSHRPGTDTFFYRQRSLTGGMRLIHFTTPKPPNTVRIVLLGGSALQGYPHPLPLTNGSFLKAMLQDVWEGEREYPWRADPATPPGTSSSPPPR